MWNHWVLRASTPHEPFRNFESARRTWITLNNLFPDALAAVLMPNHLHLILAMESAKQNLRKLNGLMGVISKHVRILGLWQSIPPPSLIPDRHHLRRQIRYVALNPCRKNLCSDPLEWYWSTYRQIMGATVNQQMKVSRLARVLGETERGFGVRFHTYVSADPSVSVTGTRPPQPAVSKLWPEESIGEILAASAAALQISTSEIQKRGPLRALFIHLACQQGWRQPPLLSQICKITPRAVHSILSHKPPKGIEAAALCLGDQRLRTKEPFEFLKK